MTDIKPRYFDRDHKDACSFRSWRPFTAIKKFVFSGGASDHYEALMMAIPNLKEAT